MRKERQHARLTPIIVTEIQEIENPTGDNVDELKARGFRIATAGSSEIADFLIEEGVEVRGRSVTGVTRFYK